MNKNNLIDLLILATIFCAFVGGFWLGERMTIDNTKTYFKNYINHGCECFIPLTEEEGKISYKVVSPTGFSNWQIAPRQEISQYSCPQ